MVATSESGQMEDCTLARKKDTKDYAIRMDEFHPRPSTAAAFADLKAHDAAEKDMKERIDRIDRQLAASSDFSQSRRLNMERGIFASTLALIQAERRDTQLLIAEAKVK